ncbi:phenylacetate--CoA ligase family protein [Microbulbifer yueqingensis]|uniref:Phenylacetate-CoA ligase n=1 Tax=Microbulbifer yueqingensis TaxID=658219 RepID=A0A1G8VLD2_9GAMM|nr:phenylacetate--CoA ligase family protein [Microbulbifer yueqingensis]SDJ66812.1 phenylacetate-CoA ligase [Microbulbifer yueqingensis]
MFSSLFYRKSPVWLQNVIVSCRGLLRKLLRETRQKDRILSELVLNEKDPQRLSLYAKKRRELVLKNAITNVDAFFRSGDTSKVTISVFPIISKADVLASPFRFRSKIKPTVLVKGSTSGTTGSPLVIPQSMESIIREQAFISRHLKWAGFEQGDRRAWIRGDLIVPVEQKAPPYWRYSKFEHMILLSSFHMTQEAMPLYIEALVEYGVDIIQTYPSSITALAKYLASIGDYYPGKIKSIVTSSECLTTADRELVEERFQCKVYDWYGLFERVAAIANCEYGRYHVLTDYSDVEFLDCGDGTYEIVGTNFNNFYYPLIRYKTGDHVILSEENSCPCGRAYPLVDRIDGRKVDFVFASSGHKIFALDQCVKGVGGILGSQFIQIREKEITVNVVSDSRFDIYEELKLVANVKDRLGKDMQVKVSKVQKLERTTNGKIKQAICKIEA